MFYAINLDVRKFILYIFQDTYYLRTLSI